jgi:hypothetical protein
MISAGAYISASSPFWAYFFTAPQLLGPVLFVIQLSLGEAVWSPRWYDYTMDVAPEGREGIFVAIAGAPLFLAKLPTGILSGVLLEQYCPEGAGCRAEAKASCHAPAAAPPPARAAAPEPVSPGTRCESVLWLIIGFVTMASPILVSLFQRWLRPGPPGSGTAQYRVIQLEDAGSQALDLQSAHQQHVDHDDALPDRMPAVPEGSEDGRWQVCEG